MTLAIVLLIAFLLALLAVAAVIQPAPVRYLGIIVLLGAVLLAALALNLP